jgi:hypothetical protein
MVFAEGVEDDYYNVGFTHIRVAGAWVLSPFFFVVAEVELSHPPEDLAWVFSDLLVLNNVSELYRCLIYVQHQCAVARVFVLTLDCTPVEVFEQFKSNRGHHQRSLRTILQAF